MFIQRSAPVFSCVQPGHTGAQIAGTQALLTSRTVIQIFNERSRRLQTHANRIILAAMKSPCAVALFLIVAAQVPATAGALHAAVPSSKHNAVVLGDEAAIVLNAIRAAEAHDMRSFKAQLSKHAMGSKPNMKSVDLHPECTLSSVIQNSSILVTARWTCRTGKVDAVATRGFVLSHGKIAAITGEPVLDYHIDTK